MFFGLTHLHSLFLENVEKDMFQGVAPFSVLELVVFCSGILYNGMHVMFWNINFVNGMRLECTINLPFFNMAKKFLPILLFHFEEARNDIEMTESDNFIENIIAVTTAM